MYPHQTDTVQIDTPEYDLDIDEDNQPNTDKKHATVSIQGTLEMIPESSVLEDDNSIAPENNMAPQNQQETNWPDTMPGPYKGFLTQCITQQQYTKPRHQPSDRDQRARDRLRNKVSNHLATKSVLWRVHFKLKLEAQHIPRR